MVDLKKRGKAVLLSSHILSEVENISDRVAFIHKGKLVKVVTRDELLHLESGSSILRLVVTNLNDDALGYLRTLGDVRSEGSAVWLSNFSVDPTQISTELIKRGFLLREFSLQKSNLEDYFFNCVGVTPADSATEGVSR